MLNTQYDSWGRIYKNWRKDGYIPEVFSHKANDYKDVFYDDNLYALSFFALRDPEYVKNTVTTAKVSLIFMVNLRKIYPETTDQRLDELAINTVRNIIDQRFNFLITDVYRDVDRVFEFYSGDMKEKGKIKWGMQPKLCFRIDMDLVNINVSQTYCLSPEEQRVYADEYSDEFYA